MRLETREGSGGLINTKCKGNTVQNGQIKSGGNRQSLETGYGNNEVLEGGKSFYKKKSNRGKEGGGGGQGEKGGEHSEEIQKTKI